MELTKNNQAFETFFESLNQNSSSLDIDHPTMVWVELINTPLGDMVICSTQSATKGGGGICLLEFFDMKKGLLLKFNKLKRYFNPMFIKGTCEHIIQATTELKNYFEGRGRTFLVPLDLCGTVFQKKVWASLMEIPYGRTISYKAQSTLLNNPLAIRAVAKSNGDNNIAIIVPCHRVIGSNGNLTGYAGGLERKRKLIALEALNY